MAADGVLYIDDEDDAGMLRAQQVRVLQANMNDYIAQLTNLMDETKAAAMEVGKKMVAAAITAPKGCGHDNVEAVMLDGDEMMQLAKITHQIGEETGVDLSNNKLTFIDVNTEPLGKRQTIAIHYYTVLDKQVENIKLTNEFAEENEVDDIRFVPISKIKDYRNILTRDQEKYIMIAYDKLNSFNICKQNIC